MSLRNKYTDEEWEELEKQVIEKIENRPIRNTLDKNYLDLVKKILDEGIEKETRNGRTKSIFGYQIRHKMSEGFPLLTTKRMSFHNIRTELEWFLNGDTNIKYLVKRGCNIWNGDAIKRYENKTNQHISEKKFIERILNDDEFAKEWGDMGPIYGVQWRNFNGKDQINQLLTDLKNNPDSRRLMVSAWNVGELDKMILPPCHYGFQIYTRDISYSERYNIWFNNNYETGMEYNENIVPNFDDNYYTYTPTKAISLMWNQRSVDVGLGLGYNIASYGLLLEMLARECLMYPDELIGNLGDTHLYNDHIDPIKEQLNRKPYDLPTIYVRDGIYSRGKEDFVLEDYQSHPSIKLPLSN